MPAEHTMTREGSAASQSAIPSIPDSGAPSQDGADQGARLANCMAGCSALAAVHRIATGLFSRSNLDEILSEALSAALDSVGAQAGSIFLHDPRDDTLVFRHVIGGAGVSLVGLRIPSNQGLAGVVFHSGKPVITGDAAKVGEHREMAEGFRTQAMVTLPLSNLGGRTVGVMQILNRCDGGAFTPEQDLVILETLASLAATAIENAQQVERARKAAVADAVGDIAHDIKNMMTPVESWAATLDMIAQDSIAALDRLMANVPEAQAADFAAVREFFDILPDGLEGIHSGSQQAKDRGAEIADALKGNVRSPVFVIELVEKTINRVCHTLKPSAEARGVTILMEGDCPPFPHDRTHIFNAVYNLVNNAIPYVPSGGTIRVILSRDGDQGEIAVADTGCGMPPEVRDSLFSGRTISTTVGGTGLGTQIVARVASAHNGLASVESELGKGSTFRLRIPMTREAVSGS